MPVKTSSFSKVEGLKPATLIKMEHFHRDILFGLALMQNIYFLEDLPMATSTWIKTDILFNIMIKERCENINIIEWMQIRFN